LGGSEVFLEFWDAFLAREDDADVFLDREDDVEAVADGFQAFSMMWMLLWVVEDAA
jgi:hypothetical protein